MGQCASAGFQVATDFLAIGKAAKLLGPLAKVTEAGGSWLSRLLAPKATAYAADRGALGRFTSEAGGDSVEAARGRSAHINYENTLGGGDYVFNKTLPGSSLRPDAYSRDLRIVRELKPDSPDAIASGWRQVNQYVAYMEQYTGESWTGYVDVYRR